MLSKTRSKIATKVAKIEVAEDFEFSKWLRVPKIHQEEVETLVSYNDVKEYQLEDLHPPTLLKLKFKLQSVSILTSKPFLGVAKPKAYLIFFGMTKPRLYEMREKFLKAPDLKEYNNGLKFDEKVIDQSDVFIVKPATVNKFNYNFNDTSLTEYPLLINTTDSKNYLYAIEEPDLSDHSVNIPTPVITDHLASLVPQIFNIELLNKEKLDDLVVDSRNFEVEKLNLPVINKIEVPGIDDILKSNISSFSIPIEELKLPDTQYFSPEINFSSHIFKVKIDSPKSIVKKVVLKQKNFDPKVIDALNDVKISERKRSEIRALLSSFRELKWDEFISQFDNIAEYQKNGAEFLSENKYLIYGEELGSEKFIQSTLALNFLLKKGTVRSVLVISDNKRFDENWENHFDRFAKSFKIERINVDVNKKITGYSTAWFLDFNDLPKIDLKKFSQIDLILFDDQLNLKSSASLIDDLITKVEPNLIWMLSSIINENFHKKFLESFSFSSKVEFKFYAKTLSEIQNDNPVVTFKDIWLYLDEMQLIEYNEAISQAKKELSRFIENPNPIRFRSHIFTLIHKLKQILNFSAFRNISPKANLLIEQTEAISRNKKKAIIFTQYDENGMKKIEKAFEMNNIKHTIARNGMSTEELKNSLSSFYNRKEIPILLTNLKPSRLNIKLNKVNYLINFDQWWNPISNWQMEDEIGLNEVVNEPVVVYNYFIKNSFEEELHKLLTLKGLFNKKVFDNLKSETVTELILMDDWLTVFGMNNKYISNLNNERVNLIEHLKNLENESFRSLMKSFFTYLGYRDLSIMDIPDETTFYIIGTARRGTTPVHLHGKCFLSGSLKYEDYEEVINLKEGANEIKRKFVITLNDFAERIANGTTYIDGADLANYILTLGMKSQILKKTA